MDPVPTIAIVGRPNVGKSTLFNRLIGKKHAIISDIAGTTRDVISQKFDCNGYQTILVDTGGLEYDKKENIEADVQSQAKVAISDASLILFVVNGNENLTVNDFTAAEILRKSKKPVFLVANKCDTPESQHNIHNLYELGFDQALAISAIHKIGIEELKTKITKNFKSLGYKQHTAEVKENPDIVNIAILGKPNAGKSSLVNALTNEKNSIVSDIPGTTRDVVDIEVKHNDKTYNLIDTAGLRRRGKIERGIEKFSSLRCINAIERANIVVLLIDGNKGITKQDTHIAQYALEAQKGLILAINKIDLIEKGEEERDYIIRRLRRKFAFIPWAPVVFLSAKNKKNIFQIFDIADEIQEERHKRIATSRFNSFMQKVTNKHLPASTKIQKPKFFYGSQVDISPPKFLLYFKNPQNLHFSYPRYLENEIRKEFGFTGTAINLKFKNKNERTIGDLKTSRG